MLTENQIAFIVKEVAEKIKGSKDKDVHHCDWGELYKEAYKHAEEIEVHSCGEFPKKLIGDNFPGETTEERDYRRKSFQPITKPYWEKAMRTMNRIWAEQNYVIDWGGDDVRDYFLKQFPIAGDIRKFFKSIVTDAKISDPNGVLLLQVDIPEKQSEEGEVTVNDSEQLAPYAAIYESEDVLMFRTGKYCLVYSTEKSIVRYSDRNEKSGYVFYLYDDAAIYKIEQVGKKIDYTFNVYLYYQHDLGYMPAWKLEGTPDDVIDGEVYYESYFAPALPHLNEAVIIHSTNKSVRNKVSYPTRVYYDQPCNNQGCNNGFIIDDSDGSPKQKTCSKCNGAGSVKFSAFRDYVHDKPTSLNDEGALSFPGLAYVSPDGKIIQDNENIIKDYLETAFLFLNIQVMNGNQKGLSDPTATKSKIDRDEQYISILDISNELFHTLEQFIRAATEIRYNEEFTGYVKKPTVFDLVSPDEIIARIKTAKDAGMSEMAISEMIVQYYEQEFGGNTARFAKIAQYTDVLFVTDTQDISILQTNGNIAKWQVVLHVNFTQLLNELIAEKGEAFETMQMPEIKTAMEDKAKVLTAELSDGTNSAANILGQIANPTANV